MRNVVVSLWIVDNLGLNWEILDSFPNSFNWLVLNDGFFDFLWNVFNLSFNGIVVGDGSFNGDSFSVGNLLIFNNFSFIGNSFNSFDLVVFNVFLFEWNVFDSALDWDLFSNNFLGQGVSELRVSAYGLVGLVD